VCIGAATFPALSGDDFLSSAMNRGIPLQVNMNSGLPLEEIRLLIFGTAGFPKSRSLRLGF